MSDEKNIKVLYSAEEIDKRVTEVAAQITKDYKDKQEEGILIIGVLNGAAIFASDLIRKIDLDIKLDFMTASSYKSGTKRNKFSSIINKVSMDLKGKHVLIVEDMIDTGKTLNKISKMLKKKGAASVKICAFLDKKIHKKDLDIAYCCFDCPNVFVFGYGLDIDQKYRNLPYVSYFETQETD